MSLMTAPSTSTTHPRELDAHHESMPPIAAARQPKPFLTGNTAYRNEVG